MSNKERTLFNSFNKSNVEIYERRRFRILHLCVCTFVRNLGKRKKNIEIPSRPLYVCVCVCVCDRAIDRGERVNLCKSKWWMEGESHLPRKPQSLSLEIKVFSFSVSLTVRNLENLTEVLNVSIFERIHIYHRSFVGSRWVISGPFWITLSHMWPCDIPHISHQQGLCVLVVLHLYFSWWKS